MDARAEVDGDRLVFTYPSGQQVAYGRNADGTFVAPGGTVATTVTADGSGYTLLDGGKTSYAFKQALAPNRFGLSSITDAQGLQLRLDWTDGVPTRIVSVPSAVHWPCPGRRVASRRWSMMPPRRGITSTATAC